MNFAIVTRYTPNISELVAPLSINKQEYCNKWGYKFFLEIKERLDINKSDGFVKIIYLLELMKLYSDIDIFVWMDNDAFIMNFKIPLTNFIIGDYDLFLGEDWNGINDGVFFIKNNINTQIFLQQVLDYKINPLEYRPCWYAMSEQCAIHDLCNTIKTCVTHHSLFNGYLQEYGINNTNDWRKHFLTPLDPNWQPRYFKLGDFAIHLAGVPNQHKTQIIKTCLAKVIK